MSALAREVARKLLDAKARLVTAESCTGGWIAKLCTDIAGSSDWFDCGYVVYSNAAKQRDLGVPQDVLEKHGAVSEQTVKALALNAIARTNANVSLAVSGIAGPTGGVPEKPVGTVWFAVGFKRYLQPAVETHQLTFTGDRDVVRRKAVEFGLSLVLDLPLNGKA
jgi:nicotinamide-nucleotide amidase